MRPARWAGAALILELLLTAAVHGQDAVFDEPVFKTFGMEAGLSQGTVNAIFQDREGLIWVGTQDGLNRFDGVSFRPFKHIRDDPTSLPDDFVLAIGDGGNGLLWIGTERGGLILFDSRTGLSQQYELPELGPWQTDAEGSNSDRRGRSVHGIVPLSDGSVAISTDRGLAHLTQADGTAIPLVPAGTTGSGHPSPKTCALPGGGGLAGFADGSLHKVGPGPNLELLVELPAEITAIRCPKLGGGFVATSEGDVFTLSLDPLHVERLLHLDAAPGLPITIKDVLLDSRGLLWVATTQGLFVGSDASELRRVGSRSSDRGLPAGEIIRLHFDTSGMLWIGTWNGLASLHPHSLFVRRVLRSQDTISGLAGTGVVAIEGGPDGDLWIGNWEGGVDRLARGWRQGAAAISKPFPLQDWAKADVFGLDWSDEGDLWIATLRRGVVRFRREEQSATAVPISTLDGTVVPDAAFYSVLADASGTVWAGTLKSGLVRYSRATRRFEEFRGPDGDWTYGSSWVWPIVEDAQGRLWVGAFNGGVTSIDPSRQNRRFYQAGPTGLSDNRILTLFAGSRGYIWIGTQGGGLNRLDPDTDEIVVYTVNEGLPHDHVEGIIEDNLGFLWITTNDGLARFDPDEEEFWVLKEASGLAGNRFFANAVHKNDRGELFFGGDAGLTILDPARIERGTSPPPVALTGFQIHGRPAPLARALGPQELDLEPNENFFTFEFAALDFTDPTLNRYKYSLENLDEDWIEIGANRVANYTSVPPGRYVFRVAARNADGVWNEDGLAIPLRVQTPYYRTWWFRSVIGLTVLLLISGFYSYRLTELHRRQKLRLDIAGGLHDDVGGNLATIIRKADRVVRAAGADERLRTEAGRVGYLARDTELKVREAVWAVKEEFDTLQALITKMQDTADLMLGGTLPFQFIAPDQVPERRIHWEKRKDVYLLYKEALNNILKHSDATFVEIEVSYEAPHLALRVTDNGKGFDSESQSGGHGVGLMRKHAARLGGEDPVSSRPGAGTTVQTSLRIG